MGRQVPWTFELQINAIAFLHSGLIGAVFGYFTAGEKHRSFPSMRFGHEEDRHLERRLCLRAFPLMR